MRQNWKLCVGTILLVLLASTPAFAVFDIHGQVFFDAYMYHQDAQGFARTGYTNFLKTPGSGGIGGVPVGSAPAAGDREQTYFDLNHATALRGHWMNKDGLGSFFAMYMNGDPQQSTASNQFKVGVSVAILYYKITPDLTLTIGKGGVTQIFSSEDPNRYMGYDGIAHVTGLGYGNINSKYQNNVRLTYNFNSNVSFDIGLFNPLLSADNESYLAAGPGFTAKTGTAVDNITKMPKVEVALPLKFKGDWGKIKFSPSAMYLESKFENVQDGHDDSITSYGLAASTKMELGDFRISGEYNFGQNLANAARVGESQCTPFKYEYITGGLYKGMMARVDSTTGDVHDGKTHSFWGQLGYEIAGKVTPTIYFGQNKSERDMPGTSADVETKTRFYGISIPIKITKNLTIAPEYTIWDNGDNNLIDGTRYDFGKESMIGIQTRLLF